ncbi:MAG TPA: LbtU family siderophore porin [Gammaproteobacteria bacterium]|nr:LbtU family siderophore porin [Gammaproteobacteria bacterium]
MKLKLVVASMSILGLIHTPVLAATTTHQKQIHHVTKTHHQTDTTLYKGAMPVEICPLTDPYISMMDAMGQNLGRAKPTQDCNKLLSFAGGVNFDAKWGNRSMGYQGENVQRVSINDVYLNLFGNVNDWTKAFASLSYNDASPVSIYANKFGQYSNVYQVTRLTVEQGYVQLSNFDQTPFFLKLGKFYQDFGRYTIHPITRSLTQVLSESLQTAAQAGFVTAMGFHGDIAAFDTPLNQRRTYALGTPQGHKTTDYTAAIGFDQMSDQLGWGLNLAYMYNMIGANDITQTISQYQSIATAPIPTAPGGFALVTTGGTYRNRVGAGAIDAYITSGPFSLMGDYVTAIQNFSNNDLNSKGQSVVVSGTGSGAKPWAGNIQAGYGFNGWNKNQNIYLGYQLSGNAISVYLPKNRWVAGYNVDMWKYTNLGLELDHDTDYSVSKGGTGNSSNLISFRAGVKFG